MWLDVRVITHPDAGSIYSYSKICSIWNIKGIKFITVVNWKNITLLLHFILCWALVQGKQGQLLDWVPGLQFLNTQESVCFQASPIKIILETFPQNFCAKMISAHNYKIYTFLQTYLCWTPGLLSVLNIIGHITGL